MIKNGLYDTLAAKLTLRTQLTRSHIIFWNENGPMQWIFYQHCGYWWPGAFSTRSSVATLLRTHPCVSSCLGLTFFPGIFHVLYGKRAVLLICWYIMSRHTYSSIIGCATWWPLLALLCWYRLIFFKSLQFTEIYALAMFKCIAVAWFNSLWPSDTVWGHKSGSTLAQIMACCLTAPSHYLNQCWLIISKVQWQSSECNFTRDASAISHWN